MNKQPHIVIVGGGQAAAQTITSLRQWGSLQPITLIGDEAHPPYQRPPLSKAYLKGEIATERLWMKPTSWYQDNNVTLKLGVRASSIDRDRKQVLLDNVDDPISYDKLVLATGSAPRKLRVAGSHLHGVAYLRDISDVQKLRELARPERKLVVIGAGYIGLEAAASMQQLGLNVVVIEAAERILSRVTSSAISDYFQSLHQRNGVVIHTSAQLREIDGDGHAVKRIKLADGTSLDADLVLIGIGILPNDSIAHACGVACDNGVLVDRDTRTSDPNVFAVGDCAHRPLVHYNRTGRLESVHNALEQGKLAAAALLERPRPKEDCPWFWSDQFGVKLQIAGLSTDFDQLVLRGDPATDRFAVFYLRDGVLIAVDAINSPKEFMGAKALIAGATRCSIDALGDPQVALKTLATSS